MTAATENLGSPVRLTHAEIFTAELCALYAGPNAAKRMAQAWQAGLETCWSYIRRRRAMSFDQAIEVAARDDRAMAALLARIEAAKVRNAAVLATPRQGPDVGVEPRLDRGHVGVGDGGRAGGTRPGCGLVLAAGEHPRPLDQAGAGQPSGRVAQARSPPDAAAP